MWAGTGASVGVVSELVNMHATLGGRIAAFDIIRNGGWGRFRRLLERHTAGDGGVASKYCNCWVVHRSAFSFIMVLSNGAPLETANGAENCITWMKRT